MTVHRKTQNLHNLLRAGNRWRQASHGVYALDVRYVVKDPWSLAADRVQQQPGNGRGIDRDRLEEPADDLAAVLGLPRRPAG